MTTIPPQELAELRRTVFDDRQSTATDAAEPYGVAMLIDTTRATRAAIRSTLQELPGDAFEPQPDDPDGNENWSAGQVVSHICEARVRFDHYGVLRQMAGLPELPPSEGWSEYIGGPKLLNRSQALEALDLLEREYDDLANAIPDDADYTERVELPPFGTMGFRGILLQSLLHEHLHEEQLRDLGESAR